MKRVNEIDEVGRENLGFKKSKLDEGIDESCSTAERNGEEQNGEKGAEQVDNSESHMGILALDDLDGHSLSGHYELLQWDYDVNFDSIFAKSEALNGLAFDLNTPVCKPLDDGMNNGCLGYTQKLMIDQKGSVVINIASDDSDDEVEVVGFTVGYNEKGKGISLELPSDTIDDEVEVVGFTVDYSKKGKGVALEMPSDTMENLNLDLGINHLSNAVGESSLSSLVSGGKRKYTEEEKGKANVEDQWLSLGPYSSVDMDLHIDTEDDPTQDLTIGLQQPALGSMPELAMRVMRGEEEVMRSRNRYAHVVRKETAKRYARMDYYDENKETGSSSKNQQPASVSPVEQLGKSPGPFAEALKVIRQRTSKRAAQTLIEWKPTQENQYNKIAKPFVHSLLDLSLKALAENSEGIMSLELVPDNLRRRLTQMLCDMRKMNADILNLLVKGSPTEICIKNCAWLTEKQLQETFQNCQTNDLRVLQLDLCGQCILELAFRDAWANSSKSFSSLCILSLRGACRLSDTGLINLVKSAPLLQSLNLGQCTLLTCDAVNCIADSLGSNLRELYIDYCQKIDPLLILPAFKKFKCLEVISVAGIPAITDEFVSAMVGACGQSLKEIDLADCVELTDNSLISIGNNCAHLRSLNISTLHNLTDLGIEYLTDGCRSIQNLKLCRNGFSDDAMAAFIESSGESLTELVLNNMTKVGPCTAFSIAKCSKKLISLDISWCRRISNEALGLIVDSCQSLKLLKVFGCRQITSVFLEGHSNPLVKMVGLNMTPLLDHMNLLETEEMLLRYSALQT